jgi:UDPglucose--hexose-1-phosphate uridylyltransferase
MSELRYDLIQGRWVIIATDRSRRPHDLQTFVRHPRESLFCPFCPGNEERTPPEILAVGRDGQKPPNGPGWRLRVIPNKYPALSVEGNLDRQSVGIYDRMRGVGAHEVVIDTPDHEADLASLPIGHVTELLTLFRERVRDLHRDRRLQYVLVFKNHGVAAGATLSHAHSQIIATPIIPRIVVQELQQARAHFERRERCLFCDILREELSGRERIVAENEHCVAFTPYASRFPFELMIAPKVHRHHLADASDPELAGLAACLTQVCRLLQTVLEDPPFNLVVHTSPNTEAFDTPPAYWRTLAQDYHWHLELMPRLTRVAGFETGTDFYINPTAPEDAARFLREAAAEAPSGTDEQKTAPGRPPRR